MFNWDNFINLGTFISAFIGAAIGVFLDRVWQRVENIPLFRIQLGYFEDVKIGEGISITIENVGLDFIPEYNVSLYHSERGSISIFNGEPKKLAFPQFPQQENEFQCVIKSNSTDRNRVQIIDQWLHHVGGKKVSAPYFANFKLRLVFRNSKQILFEDEDIGNSIVKQIYEGINGKMTEQKVDDVFYRSEAPFWVEGIRRYRLSKMMRKVKKEKN